MKFLARLLFDSNNVRLTCDTNKVVNNRQEVPVPREVLGEFAQQVLLTLLRLDEDAYSAEVVLELEEQAGRPVRTAAVYIVLRRLEEKGLVRSTMRSPGAEGGRDRRHFDVTRKGRAKMREAHAAYMRLCEGLDGVLKGTT